MRFFTPFVTAIVSLVFFDAVLASPHNSAALLRKRHVVPAPPTTNISARAKGEVLEKRFGPNARFSFYAAGLGACGKTNSASDFIVALNVAQYGSGAHCFETITITYNGKTAQATIVDECMGCPYGGLDFSTGLFNYFGSQDAGYLYGSWVFGSGEPTTTSTPPPPPTTTKAAPTSTWSPKPTTSSTTKTTSTSTSTTHTSSSVSHSTSTSTTSTSTTSSSTSASATPSATPITIPTDLFGQLDLAMVNLGAVLIGGVLIGGAAQ